jgi:hypothetical protein
MIARFKDTKNLNLGVFETWWLNKTIMENNDKEQINPDLSADNSDQELTNNIDGTKAVPESDMMSDDGSDNLEIGNMRDIEKDNKGIENVNEPHTKDKSSGSDLPQDVPNDETPPMSEMPKNYEKMSKKVANVASKDED